MQQQRILYLLLFTVFFSIGAAALGGAVLCDDLMRYCRNKHLVSEAERSIEHLESLNADYDALLGQLESDPNLLRRIAPATLGTEPEDPNAVYPKVRARELASARKALMEQVDQEPNAPAVPQWLQRGSDPRRRIALFIAGAGLILISLVFFTGRPVERQTVRPSRPVR